MRVAAVIGIGINLRLPPGMPTMCAHSTAIGAIDAAGVAVFTTTRYAATRRLLTALKLR